MNGEGAPHRLLQPTYVTCTCCRSLDSRCARSTFVVRSPSNRVAPAGHAGPVAFDDAIRASVDPSLTRSAFWRSRAPLNPGGLRYRRALEGVPPVPRRCLPRARSARRPLTLPVATSSRPLEGPLARIPATDLPPAARTAFPQSPVKDPGSVRSEAPSIDECPLDAPAPPFGETNESRTRARHRSWGFAALQSGFRRSFAASLRRGGG